MALPDAVAAQARRKGATKVNQHLRPLQSSTDSNLADLGRHSGGRAAVRWFDLCRRPHAYGRRQAPENSAVYSGRSCRGVAGHHHRRAEIGERGNRVAFALASQEDGHAHGPQKETARDGVLVVVGGRESRPQGEGGQQAGSNTEERSDDAE